MHKRWHRPRGKCLECGKELPLCAPNGNWLDSLFLRLHRLEDGNPCPGTWQEVHKITKNEWKETKP